jgi:chloride channel 2
MITQNQVLPLNKNSMGLASPSSHGSGLPQRRTYMITDFISNFDQVSRVDLNIEYNTADRFQRFLRSFHILNPSIWFMLILLGFLSALGGFVVDFLSEKLIETRRLISSTDSSFLNFSIWLIYGLSFSAIAAACGKWISPEAEGSGIPEMKTILAGVHLYKYLSFPTLLAKIVGLISATAGGLSIGREGPFVHISGIIAHKLCKLSIFRHLQENETLYNQILAASVAAGIAATFGAPIGGVLFSIEATATYYLVSNLWKGVFCAIWCVVFYTMLHNTHITDLIYLTNFEPMTFDWNIFLFALLGIVCGITGALYVWLASKLYYMRKYSVIPAIHHRFRYTLLVATLCALISYSATFLQLNDKEVINAMFMSDNMNEETAPIWQEPNLGFNLFIYTLIKIVLTALSISCPIPCGTFVPVFTAGASLGRLFGYLADLIFGTKHVGVFALVGAAALTSSVSHTLSVAVIVFELTGQIHYMIPMIVGVLFSYAFGNAFSMSIYDLLLNIKGLPYLPNLKPSELYNFKARDVMNTQIPILKMRCTLYDLYKITLENEQLKMTKIPIVDEANKLIAELNMSEIKKYVSHNLPESSLNGFKSAKPEVARLISPTFNNLKSRRELGIEMTSPLDSPPDEMDDTSIELWKKEVQIDKEHISIDTAPLSIPDDTPLAKVHFLFIMLGLMQVYVTNKGELMGVITRDSFIEHK